MPRHLKAALLATCMLALSSPAFCAANAAAPDPTAQAAAPGTEPLATGETTEQAAENGDGVASVVNDTVITDYDLRQRLALVEATSGQKPTPDREKEMRAQILEQLENERLQLLEAQKNKVTVSSGDVDKAIESILKENNLTQDKLDAMLARGNVHMPTLRSQIAAQIAWSKTVQDTYGDRADVSPEEVNEELARMAQGRNKPHFLISEIFEAVDAPEDDAKVRKNMDDLVTQLRAGAPFQTIARQFSQNPTAAQGGDLGVVVEGQLPKELNEALMTLHTGMLSPPIKSTGGYYLLLVRAREEAEGTKLPDPKAQSADDHPANLPLMRFLLPLPPKPAKDLVTRVLAIAGQIRDHIETCEVLPQLARQVHGSVLQNLGVMRVADLSPDIQKALAQTKGGETAEPFESPAGIEIIVRCDKGAGPQATAFVMPTRDAVEQQLSNERLAVLERQYMRDLRRNADIERPGDEKKKPRKVRADNN
ncbi:MAG TPA: peptidylprolyl isomerase [Rhizomicrobium sp.]